MFAVTKSDRFAVTLVCLVVTLIHFAPLQFLGNVMINATNKIAILILTLF